MKFQPIRKGIFTGGHQRVDIGACAHEEGDLQCGEDGIPCLPKRPTYMNDFSELTNGRNPATTETWGMYRPSRSR